MLSMHLCDTLTVEVRDHTAITYIMRLQDGSKVRRVPPTITIWRAFTESGRFAGILARTSVYMDVQRGCSLSVCNM